MLLLWKLLTSLLATLKMVDFCLRRLPIQAWQSITSSQLAAGARVAVEQATKWVPLCCNKVQ